MPQHTSSSVRISEPTRAAGLGGMMGEPASTRTDAFFESVAVLAQNMQLLWEAVDLSLDPVFAKMTPGTYYVGMEPHRTTPKLKIPFT